MYALKVNMRRLNLAPGRARTKHRFQNLSSCKPHHATKSSKIRHVNIEPRIYRMTASPTISSTRRTIERRSSESPICINALTSANPSDVERKSETLTGNGAFAAPFPALNCLCGAAQLDILR